MKYIYILILIAYIPYSLSSQTILFSENFEATSLPDSVTYSGSGTFGKSSMLFSEGNYSDSLAIASTGDSVIMTTQTFSTIGNHYAMLYFDHICKIDFFDEACIEVSSDNGSTWVRLSGNEYLGSGQFAIHGNKFTAASYTNVWETGTASVPTNGWWQSESFDISNLVGNTLNVKIRFVLKSVQSGSTMPDNYAWFIDNIKVVGASSELIPPVITLEPPFLPDTTYSTGPFTINAKITDLSGISIAEIIYTVNGGTPDTISMTNIGNDIYSGIIPSSTYNTTICWKIMAVDSSAALNAEYFPASGCKSILILTGPNYITIGNGTLVNNLLGWPTPYGNFYWGAKNQYIIPATELLAENLYPGPILSVAFDVKTSVGMPLHDFTIKMGHTALTELSSTFIQNLTTVYNTASYSDTLGWNTHSLQTPFIWNGYDNLVIETCFNNDSSYINASVAQTATTYPSSNVFYSNNLTTCSSLTGSPSSQRPNIKLAYAPLNHPNDAGISEVVSPKGSQAANTSINLEVKLKNYGLNSLTKAKIYYSINGITNQTPYIWTGNLAQGIESAPILIDTFSVVVGVHNIKVWSSEPNDLADTNKYNDTAIVNIAACSSTLNGTYSVGGTGADYTSLDDAVNMLHNCGISGPVVFEINPGTYTGQWEFTSIPGIDSINRVTFQSATGVNTDVSIVGSGTISDWVVSLKGAKYITFKNTTIRNNSTGDGQVIRVINGSTFNTFDGNRLITAATSSPYSYGIFDQSSAGAINDFNKYIDNYLEGGYYTIFVHGVNNTTWVKGTVIQGNEIKGSYIYPIYCYYSDSIQIIDNYIHSGAATYSYGINCCNANNQYRIIGNQVYIEATASSLCFGIRDYYCNYNLHNPNPTGHGIVANNMISISGGDNGHYGLYALNCNGTEYYYNSVRLENGSNNFHALYQHNISNNMLGQTFKNNIFANFSGGYAAYFGSPDEVKASDYNVYYTTGAYIAYWNGPVTTLSNLKSVGGKEQHSLNLIPPYTGVDDLHLTSTTLSGKGVAIPAIAVDIDGKPRGAFPTIGAHEVPLIAKDAGVTFILSPDSATTEGKTYPVLIAVTNFGSDTIIPTDLVIEYTINNGAPVSTQYSGNPIPPQNIQIVTLPQMISPAGHSIICAKTVLVGDTNYFNDELCKSLFASPPYEDVGITRIVSPLPDSIGEICFYDPATHPWYKKDVIVKIKNFGINAQTSIPVEYTFFNGGQIMTDIWTGNLAAEDSIDFLLSNLFPPQIGIQQLCAETNLPGDSVMSNNKACQTYIGRACIGIDDKVVDGFVVRQNIPNPTNGYTLIPYIIPKNGKVALVITDLPGRILHHKQVSKPAGEHQFEFNVSELPAGVYYYTLEYNNRKITRKMVVRE